MKEDLTMKTTVEAENAEAAEPMDFDKAAGDVDITAGGMGMNHSLYEVKDNECGHDYVVCEGVLRIIGDGDINCPVCKTPTDCNGQLEIMTAKEPSGRNRIGYFCTACASRFPIRYQRVLRVPKGRVLETSPGSGQFFINMSDEELAEFRQSDTTLAEWAEMKKRT
ncbi:MAG: hypothetical protein IT170_05900 [Bryobacterales bacterium]|nr:hypothetical protein [Bryobacterales bacterium]